MLRLLSALQISEVQALGGRIQERVAQSSVFKEAESLALYSSFQNEVSTHLVYREAVGLGKKVAYPRVHLQTQELHFFWVDSLAQLEVSRWGVLEPKESLGLIRADLSKIDLMLIPGLAFDRQGGRLGRGKGYYDRVLAHFQGDRLGVAYSFQVVDEIPQDVWDQPLEWLVTEEEILHILQPR